MKNIIFLMMVFSLTSAFAEENSAFMYNDHGKRDPFSPLVSATGALVTFDDASASSSDMNLEGIVLDSKGNNLAILNGKVVKAGDKIGALSVVLVANDHVDLLKGEEQITVKLKKGAL